MNATTVRKSVPISAEDQRDVTLLRKDAAYRRAYLAASGHALPVRPSEADVLHALLELGRSVLAEHLLLEGYVALAAAHDDEDRELRKVRMARRASRARD